MSTSSPFGTFKVCKSIDRCANRLQKCLTRNGFPSEWSNGVLSIQFEYITIHAHFGLSDCLRTFSNRRFSRIIRTYSWQCKEDYVELIPWCLKTTYELLVKYCSRVGMEYIFVEEYIPIDHRNIAAFKTTMVNGRWLLIPNRKGGVRSFTRGRLVDGNDLARLKQLGGHVKGVKVNDVYDHSGETSEGLEEFVEKFLVTKHQKRSRKWLRTVKRVV